MQRKYTEYAKTLCMQDTLGAGFSFDTAAIFFYYIYAFFNRPDSFLYSLNVKIAILQKVQSIGYSRIWLFGVFFIPYIAEPP